MKELRDLKDWTITSKVKGCEFERRDGRVASRRGNGCGGQKPLTIRVLGSGFQVSRVSFHLHHLQESLHHLLHHPQAHALKDLID